MQTAESTDTNEVIEQDTEQQEQETPETPASDEQPAGETPDSTETEGEGGEVASDEIIVTIGDAPPASEENEPQKAPEWVKELRKQHREQERRIKELEAELAKASGRGVEGDEPVGEKPTLESCDYDADKFEAELLAWKERQERAERKKAEAAKAAEEERKAWQAKLDAYSAKKSALRVRDFDDAEETVRDILNVTQQGVLLAGADDPALLIYALGRSPEKAKELAAINDPVAFAFAAAKMEAQLKVTPKTKAPPPERRLKGGSAAVVSTDAELAKLEAEADRTGDRSKVIAYKRRMKAAGQ